jgi:hypothetical protein
MPGRPLRIPEDLWISSNDEPEVGVNLPSKGLQRALVERGVRAVHYQRTWPVRQMARVLGKMGLVRPLIRSRPQAVVVVVTWASHATLFWSTCFHEVVPWIWDCWGQQFDRWEALLRQHKVRTAFFSARYARDYFASRIPGLEAHWLPEACEPWRFRPGKPLAQRTIHVLEMGRKRGPVHERIRPALASAGKKHLFSTPDTPKIFESHEDLYGALADNVVCICYPKTLTHPDGAGGVETMTQRYLEAIGSGAIAAGVCPAELKDLFGFDPVIALPDDRADEVLLDILGRPQEYQAHADRCRERLLEVGTFEVRVREMLEVLRRTRSNGAP